MNKIKHDDPILKNPLLLLDPVNQAPAIATRRWHVQCGIIKPGCTSQSSRRNLMSVFDGFTPTLTVSSNSLVNLDGYRSLKIENGAAIILDTAKLGIVSLPQSGVFGYVIANFSNSRCSIRLSNGGLVGGSPTFLLSSFGKSGGENSPGWCARWYFDGQNLNLA